MGADGQLQLYNPAFGAMWRIDDIHLRDSPHIHDVLSHIPQELSKNALGYDLLENVPEWIFARESHVGTWARADGRIIEYAFVPLPDGGTMLTQNDVTERLQVEQALRERSEALEAADKLRSEFITNMSYELRTPLNSIIGFSQMLDQQISGPMTQAQSEQIRAVLSSADTLKDMISDILDLAVIEAGEMEVSFSQINIKALIEDGASLASDRAAKENVRLVPDIDRDIMVDGDDRRIKQALYNMLAVLMDLVRQSTDINIGANISEGMLQLSVIAKACAASTMDRDDKYTALKLGRIPPGSRSTGLDLALVRSIATLHARELHIYPYDEKGIELVFQIPLEQER